MMPIKPHLQGEKQCSCNTREEQQVRSKRQSRLQNFGNHADLVARQERQRCARSPEQQGQKGKRRFTEDLVREAPATVFQSVPQARCQRLNAAKFLVDDVFGKGVDVVAGPVENKAACRVVEQHEKDCSHAVELPFVAPREVVRIDERACQIDRRHNERHYVERHGTEADGFVGLGKVVQPQKRDALKRLKVRQEVIGREKERDLQEKANGRA